MKVLLDENLPHELRHHLPGHQTYTVHYMGCSGVKNGLLLSKAAADGFDVMLTMDSGVRYQQNAATLPLTVIVLSASSNDMDDLILLVTSIIKALSNTSPKTFLRIP
jgi:predicted nuclease of predicted toxin-antitoxin system